jgi:hypothetical protein
VNFVTNILNSSWTRCIVTFSGLRILPYMYYKRANLLSIPVMVVNFVEDAYNSRHFRIPVNRKTVLSAMLVRPRPMCPRPKILGCCIPWTKLPLAILPLTEPFHPQISIFKSF